MLLATESQLYKVPALSPSKGASHENADSSTSSPQAGCSVASQKQGEEYQQGATRAGCYAFG